LFDLLEERRRQKITRICDIPIVVIEIGRGLKNVIIRSGIRRRNHGRTIRRRNNVPSIVVRNLLVVKGTTHFKPRMVVLQ